MAMKPHEDNCPEYERRRADASVPAECRLIDALYHGDYEEAFVDPVQERRFAEWLIECSGRTDGGVVHFQFGAGGNDDGPWSCWLVLTREDDDRGGLYMPTATATREEANARPDFVPAEWPTFEYEWPEGLTT